MFEEPRQSIEKVVRLTDAIDDAVEPADEPGNRVMVDNARLVRFAGPLFGLCSLILFPWIVITSIVLPSRQVSEKLRYRMGRL
jgi:hypothetical protein